MRFALVMLMLACAGATAQSGDLAAPPVPAGTIKLPSLPQATMAVPWTDFKAILEELQRATQPQPKEKPKPPVPWTIAESSYEVDASRAESVRVDATLTIQIWQEDGWARIPVVGDSVGLSKVLLNGEPVALVGDGQGWLTLLVEGSGEYTLTMEFFVTCMSSEGVVSFEFPCAESPVTRMALTTPVKEATVRSDMASNVTVTRGDQGLRADLAFRRTKSLAVQYTLPALLPKAPAPVEPRVACTVWTLADLTENYVACRTMLRYSVLRGSVDQFTLTFPGGTNLLNVAGQGAAWTQNPASDALTAEVKVNHPVTDAYDLELTYEVPYAGQVVAVPDLQASGVVRESGYVGVTVRGNLETSPGATVEGLVRIDAGELPPELLGMSARPVLLAFRYGEGTRLLALEVRRLEDVPMPDSAIELAGLTTVLTENGMAVTRAAYDMRNSVRQFLRIHLDPKAEIWSARVGGQVVKPGRYGDSGDVLVPLDKSVQVDRRPGTFPVELLYMEHIQAPSGFWDEVALKAPSTDVMAGEVAWEIYLPEDRRLYDSAGDLKPFDKFRITEALNIHRPATRTKQETVRRLREGIERFLITDINNPAGSAGIQGPPRYTGTPLAPERAGSAPAISAVAGVLPVPIDLPMTGVPYTFHAVLTPQGKALSLTVTTYPRWVSRLCQGGLAVGVFLTGFLTLLAMAKSIRLVRDRSRKAAFTFALFLLGVAALLFGNRGLGIGLTPAAWGAALALVVGAGPFVIRCLGSRPDGRKRATAAEGAES